MMSGAGLRRRQRGAAVLSAVGIVAGAASGAWGQGPLFQELWPGSPWQSVYVSGVSADGTVAAGSLQAVSGGPGAFRWTESGGFEILHEPVPWDWYGSGPISGDGSVIIGDVMLWRYDEPVLWTEGGGVPPALPYPSGFNSATAMGISTDGSVVVGICSNITNTGTLVASGTVEWQSGSPRLLPPLVDGAYSQANAVSGDGMVVVGWSNSRAVRWVGSGGAEELGTPQGGTSSAQAISRDGTVAAGAGTGGVMIWRGGGLEVLGLLPGMMGAGVSGVSADGGVLVGNVTPDGMNRRALVWTLALGLRDLREVLVEMGADLTGWTLQVATGESDNGRVIVGYGVNPSGLTRGWIARLPRGFGCYANCDGSLADPALNVQDFTCFFQKFAQGASYANCDGSTAPPVLNVQDFTCFLQKFAAGCQ
jgi:uncharacterized membrane protein